MDSIARFNEREPVQLVYFLRIFFVPGTEMPQKKKEKGKRKKEKEREIQTVGDKVITSLHFVSFQIRFVPFRSVPFIDLPNQPYIQQTNEHEKRKIKAQSNSSSSQPQTPHSIPTCRSQCQP